MNISIIGSINANINVNIFDIGINIGADIEDANIDAIIAINKDSIFISLLL